MEMGNYFFLFFFLALGRTEMSDLNQMRIMIMMMIWGLVELGPKMGWCDPSVTDYGLEGPMVDPHGRALGVGTV